MSVYQIHFYCKILIQNCQQTIDRPLNSDFNSKPYHIL